MSERSHFASAVSGLHAFARTVAPRRPITVSQWADAHRVLSSKGSAMPGRWVTDRNPPLREPMDAMSARSAVQDVVLKFPIQYGKTEVAINALGYMMTEDPGPIMVALPGEVSMNKWVAQKLNPMIEECPVVQQALTSVASRDASNTRTFKDFAGGQLYMEHAGTPSRLKSTTVKTLLVDEVDEFAANLTSGDDPMDMLLGRTSAFPASHRHLFISTPQIKGISRIDALFEDSDQRHYHVPCPHCGHMQPLLWKGLHWNEGCTTAWYTCCECGSMIEEHHKSAMIAAGRWVAHNPEHASHGRKRGYTINALYYAFGLGPRWHDLAAMWLAAQNDPAKLKTFINDRLAESWEDSASRNVKVDSLRDRAEPYRLRQVPAGALVCTAGVDTQDDRLEVQIVAWGQGMDFWVVDYVVLRGDPAEAAVWDALTELLNSPLQHTSGASLHVEAVAIDMGGHKTEDVKHYGRQRRVRRPMVVHGAIARNAPVLGKGKLSDINWSGRTDKRGVVVYQVGTIDAKDWLYGRLRADAEREPDKRRCHFSADLDEAYYRGLTSEIYDPRSGRYVKKRGARNEMLDTFVYALAAAHHPELRLHRWTQAQWQQAAERLQAAAGGPGQSDADQISGAVAQAERGVSALPGSGRRKRVDWSRFVG